MTEERLIALETRQTFQEDTIATLDEVVTRQQRQIDELGRRLAILTERVERQEGVSEGAANMEERPPHY